LPIDQEPKIGSTNYITSGAVAIVDTNLRSEIDIHKNNNVNPHNVTAAQLGLGSVVNTIMDEIPSDTDHYVKSRGVKNAIDAVQANLNSHVLISEANTNPHHTNK
jgi:hypothetical protein